MDFAFTTEQEAFRRELRTWLSAHVPQEARQLRHLQPQATQQDLAFLKQWQRQCFEGAG